MNRITILAFFSGFFLIIVGAAWIYRPLGPLLAGAMLLATAMTSARNKS